MTRKQKFTKNEWLKLFEDFESSGMTVADFCREKGFSVPTFYARKKSLLRLKCSAHPKPAFIKLNRMTPKRGVVCSIQFCGLTIKCSEWPPIDWLKNAAAFRGDGS